MHIYIQSLEKSKTVSIKIYLLYLHLKIFFMLSLLDYMASE